MAKGFQKILVSCSLLLLFIASFFAGHSPTISVAATEEPTEVATAQGTLSSDITPKSGIWIAEDITFKTKDDKTRTLSLEFTVAVDAKSVNVVNVAYVPFFWSEISSI